MAASGKNESIVAKRRRRSVAALAGVIGGVWRRRLGIRKKRNGVAAASAKKIDAEISGVISAAWRKSVGSGGDQYRGIAGGVASCRRNER